jgi:hypothetical protein
VIIDIITGNFFFPVLINGLKSAEIYYLKNKYINTLTTSIQKLSEYFVFGF